MLFINIYKNKNEYIENENIVVTRDEQKSHQTFSNLQ